jgi:hypothetical protein
MSAISTIIASLTLSRSNQYSNEGYDYPPNIRESFTDLGRSISDKVSLLSKASSPSEAGAAFTAPPSTKPQPKTFNHAIARASLASSQLLIETHPSGVGEDPLATALEKYALTEEKVGEARLAQDHQIQSRFLAGWNTTLNTNLAFARGMNPDDEGSLSGEARAEIEAAEDDFVTQTEEAVGVMKNVCRSLSTSCVLSLTNRALQVLDTPEPLRNLADLIAAQLEFHKKAYEILSELAPVVDGLKVEQEASYRKSREGA